MSSRQLLFQDLADQAHLAVQTGDLNALNKCLNKGLPLCVLYKGGDSLAALAAWQKNEEFLSYLLRLEPRLGNLANFRGYTALHSVAFHMKGLLPKVLQAMVDAGCAPNLAATGSNGKSVYETYIHDKPSREKKILPIVQAGENMESAPWEEPHYWWESPVIIEHPKFGLVIREQTIITAPVLNKYPALLDCFEDKDLGDVFLPRETRYASVPLLCRHRALSPDEHEERIRVTAASRATDCHGAFPIRAPYAWRPYQRAGIDFLIRHQHVLLADEMGLGKTGQVIGAVNALTDLSKVLIVCPAMARGVWEREWRLFSSRDELAVTVLETNCVSSPELKVGICSYECLVRTKWLRKENWDLVVLDECHFAKNPDAKRTAAATKLKAKWRFALSGTPILSSGSDLLPVLGWLRPDLFGESGSLSQATEQAIESGNYLLLQDRLRATLMVRRLKAEVLSDLPLKTRQIVPVRPGVADELAKAVSVEAAFFAEAHDIVFAAEQEYAVAKLDSKEACAEARRALAECVAERKSDLFKIQHQIGRSKVPSLLQHTEDLLINGRKVIVFVKHHDVADTMMCGLESRGISAVLLNGTLAPEQRATSIDSFQSDAKIRVIVAGIDVANCAITLHAGTNVVFGELVWTPSLMLQCEDRAHRIGQRDAVHCQYLIAGALEFRICRVLEDKAKIVGESLGAAKNDDDSWLFTNSHNWNHALRHVGFVALEERGKKAAHEELVAARNQLEFNRGRLSNPIDLALAEKLITISAWTPNQRGAALLLAKRIVRRQTDGSPSDLGSAAGR